MCRIWQGTLTPERRGSMIAANAKSLATSWRESQSDGEPNLGYTMFGAVFVAAFHDPL